VAAGRAALADGAEVLLLDDGFQHLKLARDLDIVCLRGDEHRRRVLPAGPLREPLSALAVADAAVRVGVDAGARDAEPGPGEPEPPAPEDAAAVEARGPLRRWLPAGAAWCEALVTAREVLLPGEQPAPPGALRGMRVGLLCAIARHERFVAAVEGLGAQVEAVHARQDHHVFGEGELENLRQDLTWVTTEKDAARLPRWFPAAVLRVGLRFTEGGRDLRARVLRAAGVEEP
jgi:tetraacyldisaccharide 4'-kinase